MGKRGPAPTPTALRVLKGDREDRINRNEPKPSASPVRCPAWVSREGRRVWRRLAPDLIRKGVLTFWDVDTFADLCELVVLNQRAVADVIENGSSLTVIDRVLADGTEVAKVVRNPAWQVARESTSLLVTVGGRFGLNPSARQDLDVTPAGTVSSSRGASRLLS